MGGGTDDRIGLVDGLRRGLFMRRVRKSQEDLPGGSAPEPTRPVRRALRVMLGSPGRTWPLADLAARARIGRATLFDLGVAMSRTGLAEVIWFEGDRSIRLTESGFAQVPDMLAQFSSQAPAVILFRDGPRAFGFAFVTRHRDRVWRRNFKRANAEREIDAAPNELDLLE